mgnify:CR=1 FL=1
MASITLAGTLLDPNGDLAVGDQVRFTHSSTTGQTVKGAVSVITINPSGTYTLPLQYGLVLVEYKDVRSTQFKNLGVATVNSTNTATSIPELLNALVPVSSAELIEFQAILADAVAAKVAAEAAKVAAEAAAFSKKDITLIPAFTANGFASTTFDMYYTVDGSFLKKLNDTSLYSPPSGGLLRDPSIILVGNEYFVVHTIVPIGSYATSKYGIAKSTNLVDWEFVADIELSGTFPGLVNAWAPEWFVDVDGSTYVIIAIDFTTYFIPHSGANLQTAGTPVDVGLPANTYIDGNVIVEDGDYVMFIKNETTKYIERWQSTTLLSGWFNTGSGDWAGFGVGVEGSSIVRLNDGTVRIYFDSYSTFKYFYSSAASAKSNTWASRQELDNYSGEIRHFTALIAKDTGTVGLINAISGTTAVVPNRLINSGPRIGEVITAKNDTPLNNTMANYQCANAYAVFQARDENNKNGIDIVVRPASGYSAIEALPLVGAPKEAIKLDHETGKPEFPHGVQQRVTFPISGFVNSWAAFNVLPTYYKSDDGHVQLRGTVRSGVTTSGTVIATLPVGFSPPVNIITFPVVDDGTAIGIVAVMLNGDIQILAGTNVNLDLSSVSYYINS